MKNILFFAAIAASLCSFKPAGTNIKELELGTKAPMAEMQLKDISGKMLSVTNTKQESGLLVIFSCNTCPFVIAWEDRYNKLAQECEKNNIGMMVVNSNDARRGGDDSFEAMQTHAKEQGYKFNYVLDEGAALADAFGATRTPHVFLFDKDLKLVYKGAIDDNSESASAVTKPYLSNAIQNLAAGKAIDPASTKSLGCSIKRKV